MTDDRLLQRESLRVAVTAAWEAAGLTENGVRVDEMCYLADVYVGVRTDRHTGRVPSLASQDEWYEDGFNAVDKWTKEQK